MPFAKMEPAKYPPRLWGLVGHPGSGKSTFAAQLLGPLLVVDADHRFTEALRTRAILRSTSCPTYHPTTPTPTAFRRFSPRTCQARRSTPSSLTRSQRSSRHSSPRRLRIDKYVAGRVGMFRRRNNLTWAHHAEVASPEPSELQPWGIPSRQT